MPKDNYYAVAIGHHPGVYRTSEEFSAQLSGFKGERPAIGKKFNSEKEALNFIWQQISAKHITRKKSKKNWFYAVGLGGRPGVYQSNEEYVNSLRGNGLCFGRKFANLDKASLYLVEMRNNTQEALVKYHNLNLDEPSISNLEEFYAEPVKKVLTSHKDSATITKRQDVDIIAEITYLLNSHDMKRGEILQSVSDDLVNEIEKMNITKTFVTLVTKKNTLTYKTNRFEEVLPISNRFQINFYADGSFRNPTSNGWAFSLYINDYNFGHLAGSLKAQCFADENSQTFIDSNCMELVAVGEIFSTLVRSKTLCSGLKKYNSLIVIFCDNLGVIHQFTHNNINNKYSSFASIYLEYKKELERQGFNIILNFVPSKSNERHNEVDFIASECNSVF